MKMDRNIPLLMIFGYGENEDTIETDNLIFQYCAVHKARSIIFGTTPDTIKYYYKIPVCRQTFNNWSCFRRPNTSIMFGTKVYTIFTTGF